jgi:phospholipid/cholesterol/gamma-HCH transport system ATP-binding protein
MSIHFKNVHKSFGAKNVLNDISFSVGKGEILFILGRSGMGKSVILKHLVGLIRPDQGEISVDGIIVNQLSERELSSVRQICAMVFQHPALFDSLSIFDNIAFGLRGQDPKRVQERVHECLGLVHLDPQVLSKYPSEISYGMQKRVSLARSIAPGPQYVLFDEPTTGLDPITTTAINELILELSRKMQVTSLVVSHDMGCALKAADKILVLDQSKVLAHASVEQIKRHQAPLIQQFLKESVVG